MLKINQQLIENASSTYVKKCTTIAHHGVAVLDSRDPGSKRLLGGFLTIPRMKGWFDVAIHGSEQNDPFSFFSIHSPGPDNTKARFRVSAEQLAKTIRNSGWRSMMAIRLYACHGACRDEHGVPLAKKLAILLNTEVMASNKYNTNWSQGFIALPPSQETGPTRYTVFHPSDKLNERKLRLVKSTDDIAKGTPDKRYHW